MIRILPTFLRFYGAAILSVLALATAGPAAADTELYQDLGGREGITRFVDATFDYVVKDDRIKAEFTDNNMDRIKRMVSDYVCQIVGGPCVYKGADMKMVHRGVHANDSDFNALVEDLQKAMDDSGIPFRTQNRLLALLAPDEHDIVTK